MTRYVDKGTAFTFGIALLVLFSMLCPVLQILGWYASPDSPAYLGILIVCNAIAVFGATAGSVNAGSMIADVTDEHELRTGHRQEGIFFAALAFAVKATVGIGPFVAGVSLDLIGLAPGSAPVAVSPETVRSLGMLYGPGTAILGVISVVILSGYRLDRKRHAEVIEALATRRATKTSSTTSKPSN
jgi:GPH family glycoside/pentoside/hexuronide:cation symporter